MGERAIQFEDEEDDFGCRTIFPVELDDVAVARLMEICESAKVEPCVMLAAIVADVLEDDARQHDPTKGPDIVRPNSNNDLH